MLHLRRYLPADRDAVRATFRTIFDRSELPHFDVNSFDGPSIIGLNTEGLVCAFILVEQTPEGYTDCEIAYLGVATAWRRHGYARKLIRTVQEVACNGVWLKVLERNSIARRLYEELGFIIGERYTVDGEVGLTLVWGVEYRCSLCSRLLTPATVVWFGLAEKTHPLCRECHGSNSSSL
jgi:ribosomal protein S18 acetylase RimI-like enzyme